MAACRGFIADVRDCGTRLWRDGAGPRGFVTNTNGEKKKSQKTRTEQPGGSPAHGRAASGRGGSSAISARLGALRRLFSS